MAASVPGNPAALCTYISDTSKLRDISVKYVKRTHKNKINDGVILMFFKLWFCVIYIQLYIKILSYISKSFVISDPYLILLW